MSRLKNIKTSYEGTYGAELVSAPSTATFVAACTGAARDVLVLPFAPAPILMVERGRPVSEPEPRRSPHRAGRRLRRLTDLIHVFDMRGSAVARPAPRPLHDFESSARRTGQDPSVVVRREGDRYVVLGRDPVAQLRHIYRVPQIHNVETSVETA